MDHQTDELAAVLDALPAHIAVLDTDGMIVSVNRAWRRFACANVLDNASFSVGDNYLSACDRAHGECADEAAQVADGIRDVLRGRIELFELDYPCHSPNEQRWFRLSAMRTNQAVRAHVVVMHVNVTDKKLAEIALNDSYRKQQALSARLAQKGAKLVAAQAVAKVGSIEIDLQTLQMTWSAEVFHILGIAEGDLSPTLDDFLGAVHPDDADTFIEAIDRSRKTREICSINHRIVTPAGTIKFVTERWQTFVDASGVLVSAIGTCQDNSERVALEAKLRQSERLEALGQLTGGVAHDFNNLLTVILGNAETLSGELAGQHTLKELADITATAAERAAELTGRLLAFARRQGLSPRSIDLNKRVADMNGLLRRTLSEDIDLSVTPGAGLWSALIDPGQLEVAVLNLVINARDAMPGGGRLAIEMSNAVLDADYAATHDEVSPGNYVMLSIADTGIGMDQATLERAVEPFFTTKDVGKGSGLGLSMVYGFIKQSKGHIAISSEPGQGSTVRLYLPKAVDIASVQIPAAPFPLPKGNELVLVVEDDNLVREFASTQLRSLGYRVIEAADGLKALALLRARKDIALLFTDIVMPNGVDGRTLAESARQLQPDLRVLFTSGYAESAMTRLDRLRDGFVMLSKPYRKRELAEKVRFVLEEVQLAAE